jgi:acyl transferase domain-containing protein/NADPH:quinone reductase-like Zn-dependent oxidoreductase/NAD(P)-dependent dehydrogenase (short-subunit alcohol dehydrogenase family)
MRTTSRPAIETPRFAIVGVGCRLPPASNSLEEFWAFLLAAGDAIRDTPKERWDFRQFYDPEPGRPGKAYVNRAAWLEADLRSLDATAFGISPREAAGLDPQQRLLLESAWDAFEDAGIPLERLAGSPTGVFVGAFNVDHFILNTQPTNRVLAHAGSAASVSLSMLSNRISHVFDLRGPSLTLDTACSSSLVAVHYACSSLARGESDLALAGGVNAMLRPELPILLSKGQFLSAHGECRTFDASAAGYARGEGAGLFLIERYEDALAAGHRIHAVIRASAVNQDGHTDGISLPSGAAQRLLIEGVYRAAGVAPSEVDYVEAHGTGTQAGDPIEVRALQESLARHRPDSEKLPIGSVKTNLGHLEAAAGVAGLLKAIGVLTWRQIPKNLHFGAPNPTISLSGSGLRVVAETEALPAVADKPRLIVGVNSFGYGGTNAHVVLESAPAPCEAATLPDGERLDGGPLLIPLSARSPLALRDLASRLAFEIGREDAPSVDDVAFTAAFHRSHLEYRAAVLASDGEQFRERLSALASGERHADVSVGEGAAEPPELVFVYTGMGPQWWGMGQELLAQDVDFREAIAETDGYFRALAGWSLLDAMRANEAESRIARTDVAQPTSFALQVALTRYWQARGVQPTAVVGHSAGEVAAALVAGIYPLAAAVRIIYQRSRLQQRLAGRGAMLAVALPAAEAELLTVDRPGVAIAAINSFRSVTLSGDRAQLERVARLLAQREVFHRFLRVDVAYHSPHMDELEAEMCELLADLEPQQPRLPLYSAAYGRRVLAEDWGPRYWWQSSRAPVRFSEAVASLLSDGRRHFLEIGPHPALVGFIQECAADLGQRVQCFSSLQRKEPERSTLQHALAELYCAGANLDFGALAPRRGKRVEFPRYSWQRQTLWVESEGSQMDRLGLPGSVYLNRSVPGVNGCWEVEINRHYFPFLFDHGIADQAVFPGMAYVDAALALSQRLSGMTGAWLELVSLDKVLVIDTAKLQVLIVRGEAAGRFSVSSRVEGELGHVERHCHGRIYPQAELEAPTLDLAELRAACPTPVSVAAFYESLQGRGLQYGPRFRGIVDLRFGNAGYLAEIDGAAGRADDTHCLHPALFDAAIQPILYGIPGGRLFVPRAIEQFRYYSRPSTDRLYAFGKELSRHETSSVSEVWLMDARGRVHAHAGRVVAELLDTGAETEPSSSLHEIVWQPAELERSAPKDGSNVLILADGPEADLALARALESALPGSALVIGRVGRSGCETSAWIELLSAAAHRRQNCLIALWGTAEPPETSPLEIAAGQERRLTFLRALAECRTEPIDLTLVSRSAKVVLPSDPLPHFAASSAAALALVAESEIEALTCRSIDLGTDDVRQSAEQIAREVALATRGEIAWRNGQRFRAILRPFAGGLVGQDAKRSAFDTGGALTSLEEPLELCFDRRGDIGSLHFRRVERRAPSPLEIEVRVHRAGLNYKDVLKVRGALPLVAREHTASGAELGLECAGVVTRAGAESRFQSGDRVVVSCARALRSYLTVPESWAFSIPEGLGMEAAAIPVAFVTAQRALVDIANLLPGERVLIHSASGGLGQALIAVARSCGAQLFATAGSEERRAFLRELGVEHVFSSRGLEFGAGVQQATRGQGVDVVVSALSGAALHVSLGLLRSGGRYIDVGKRDSAEDLDLPMRAFNHNLTFASLDVDRLAHEQPHVAQRALQHILGRFERGDLQLGPTTVFAAADAQQAFATMLERRHIGKQLLDFERGCVPVRDDALTRLVRRDGAYVITGGTTGFGLTTARWLARQGAGKLVLLSRSGERAPGAQAAARELEAQGTRVELLSVDVCRLESVRAALERASESPYTLRGVVHAAMVLGDERLANLHVESFRRVFSPKVLGALNLVEALREPRELDFLVFYSSLAALVGNPGQASYAAANATLDGLAHALRARGIRATSINWGALAESGVIARDARLSEVLSASGVTGLRDQQALAALELALRSGRAQLGAFLVDWQKWAAAHPKMAAAPIFGALRARLQTQNDAARRMHELLAARSSEERRTAVEQQLGEVLAKVLKLDRQQLSATRKLSQMGIDSLLVVELALAIDQRIGVRFSTIELLKGPSLQQLSELALGRLWPA